MGATGTDTWGISGPTFVYLYLALCGLVGAGVWLYRRRLLGPPGPGDGGAKLDAYQLALLNGGPALAITTAAAKLRQEGHLRPGSRRRTLQAEGRLHARADPLERQVFEAVERQPDISAAALRRELEPAASIDEKAAGLTRAGLLLDARAAARLGALWTAGAALVALGVIRILAGAQNHRPVGYLGLMVVAVAVSSLIVARRRPRASARGLAVVAQERGRRAGLRRSKVAAEIPIAVALYGAGALWAADPAFAAAWAVPREGSGLGGGFVGGTGGGCGGGGGGGCGGGGGGGCGG